LQEELSATARVANTLKAAKMNSLNRDLIRNTTSFNAAKSIKIVRYTLWRASSALTQSESYRQHLCNSIGGRPMPVSEEKNGVWRGAKVILRSAANRQIGGRTFERCLREMFFRLKRRECSHLPASDVDLEIA
jgi:hypothetical protein